MSKYFTYAQLKAKVEMDLDLEGETFITAAEMLGYANEAIDEVERKIHTLYSDYFLTRTTISLVSGTEVYDLPSDIYAMMIRGLVYRNGSSSWQLERIREWHKFDQYEFDKTGTSENARYGYFVVNTTAGNPQLILTPTPNESGAFLHMWYIRNANEMVDDTSVCDIPEAVNYVMQYMKVRCYEKEMSPNVERSRADLEYQKQTTMDTLAQMFPDVQTEIEADMRLYRDMT